MNIILQINQVSFDPILSNISLAFEKGDKIVISGESGSGKTTFLKLLNQLISPSRGELFFKGRSFEELAPGMIRKAIFYLQQESSLFTGTVEEELDYIGHWKRFSECAPKTKLEKEEILEMCQLPVKLDQTTLKFSGGEKQRLCLARTFLWEPDVVLLDEPTSALDERKALAVLKALFSRYPNLVVLFVSHQEIIWSLADRLLKVENRGIFEQKA